MLRKSNRIGLIIAIMMVITALFGGSLQPVAAAQLSDVNGHWAEVQIKSLIDQGVINGYPDQTFKPGNAITRAEFITMANRAFAYTATAAIDYSDVSSTDWYAAEIAKAKAAAYIAGYEDGTMKPNAQISRQEVAKIMATIMKLDISNGVINYFSDAESFPSWSKDYIAAMVKAAFLNGYPDGSFKPAVSITRAEAAVILSRALNIATFTQTVFDKAGTYGPAIGTRTLQANATITADGVTLQNIMIEGDLLIDAGDGTVTLKNVTVSGTTTIKSADKVILDHSVLNLVKVNDADNQLDLVLLNDSQIVELVLDSAANVSGSGVGTAVINVKGVTLEVAPAKTTVKSGLSANVGGKTVYGSGGAGGGGSSGGGNGGGGVTVTAPLLTNVKIGDGTNTINPTVAGTTLTFSVNPAAAYNTGTATLSANANYTITSGAYSVTATATTSDNLLTKALEALAANSGTNGDVLGSTLISNSPVTIKLEATADPSKITTYTINFVAATAPTLTGVTVGGISPAEGSGTTLTFSVNPTTPYTTGTATLSNNTKYTISYGANTISAPAKTTDNLVQLALAALAAHGGTSGDGVLGSTLIGNSSVTIKIAAEADPTLFTTYTINFVAQTEAPTLSNVTIGGDAPVVTVIAGQSGTAPNFTLTFYVDPAAAYKTGTSILSTDVDFTILYGANTYTETANTTDDLVQLALNALVAKGGTPGDGVLGSTLIANTDVSITLTGAHGSTVYTVHFVAAP